MTLEKKSLLKEINERRHDNTARTCGLCAPNDNCPCRRYIYTCVCDLLTYDSQSLGASEQVSATTHLMTSSFLSDVDTGFDIVNAAVNVADYFTAYVTMKVFVVLTIAVVSGRSGSDRK